MNLLEIIRAIQLSKSDAIFNIRADTEELLLAALPKLFPDYVTEVGEAIASPGTTVDTSKSVNKVHYYHRKAVGGTFEEEMKKLIEDREAIIKFKDKGASLLALSVAGKRSPAVLEMLSSLSIRISTMDNRCIGTVYRSCVSPAGYIEVIEL